MLPEVDYLIMIPEWPCWNSWCHSLAVMGEIATGLLHLDPLVPCRSTGVLN